MNLSGSPLDYLVAFFGGILVSFTPCVYPLIPVSSSFIAVRSGGSRLKGFFLSMLYVSGLAFTYSILGLIASLTGTIFGEIASSPIAYLLVGVIIIFFGLSFLDLFTISFPSIIKKPVHKKQGYFSAFLLGLSSGLIASPCLTPVLGSILAYLATKKSLLYGATLLFSFAYGMGFLLILAGTFSTVVLLSLPRSGAWILYVKKICSFILISMGIFFIYSGLKRLY